MQLELPQIASFADQLTGRDVRRIDTHGTPVDAQAWALLEDAYRLFGPVPTLLERDFNFPPMDELLDEVRRIKQLQIASESRSAANG